MKFLEIKASRKSRPFVAAILERSRHAEIIAAEMAYWKLLHAGANCAANALSG
jgi:hypothetical protein